MKLLPLAFVLAAIPAFAQTGTVERTIYPAKQVIVLANENVPASFDVARHYCAKRGIPEANICRLKTTPKEILSWPDLREQILKPVGRFLEKFPEAVYVVPVWGIPSRVSEENAENDAPKDEEDNTITKFVTNRDYGCVDAEIALIARPGHDIEGWIESDLFGKNERVVPTHRFFIVSRLDGLTPEIAKGLVDKAVYAETYGPEGESYLDTRGLDPATAYGYTDEQMRLTAGVFERHGRALRHEDTEEEQDVSTLKDCLFYWGWYATDWNGTGAFEFRPGAVAAHLHSSSACTIRTEQKFWVGPLLSHGVTCTTGTVFEPLTAGFPRMDIVFDRLFQGYTWGESVAMGNQMISWMAVFVGDPLYAPFAKGMAERQEKNRELAKSGYKKSVALVDAGDLEGARKVLEDMHNLGVPFEGAENPAFLSREIAARTLAPGTGTIEALLAALAEGAAAEKAADAKGAADAYAKAVKLSPLSFEANLALGLLESSAGKHAAALPFLENCARVDPRAASLAEPYGLALAAAGKHKEAVPVLEAAFEAGAGAEVLNALGTCYLRLGKKEEAVTAFKQAIAKDQMDRDPLLALAKIQHDLKDDAGALKTLLEAARIPPANLEDIPAFKAVWKEAWTAAERAKDRREKENIEFVMKDFDLPDFTPPSKGVWLDLNKAADAAGGDAAAQPLGIIPKRPLKVPGLPRLVVGNLNPGTVTIWFKGPSSRQIKLLPAAANGRNQAREFGMWPGDYSVTIVSQKGNEKKIVTGRLVLELDQAYGMTVSPKLLLDFPKE